MIKATKGYDTSEDSGSPEESAPEPESLLSDPEDNPPEEDLPLFPPEAEPPLFPDEDGISDVSTYVVKFL